MKLPGLEDGEQIAALTVYVCLLLALCLGLTLVVVTLAQLKGGGLLAGFAGICISTAGGVIGVRALRTSSKRKGPDG